MTSDPRANPDPARPVPEAANLGVARPPLVYLGSIALGVILHRVRPVSLLPRGRPRGSVGDRLVSIRRSHFAGRWHACPGQSAHDDNRAHGTLSFQPEPHLSGLLASPARNRAVGEQPMVSSHASCRGGRHVARRDPERGTVLGGTLPF